MANPFAKAAKLNTTKNANPIIVGQIRQTQMITTFGIGSIVDFIDKTVIIAGADDWEDRDDLRIYNENLNILTGAEYFISPKTETGEVFWKQSPDIPAYFFPEKIFCPDCNNIFDYKEIIWKTPKCPNCQKRRIVASRFIIVCDNGHMEDFPYSWWVHSGKECPKSPNPRIKMYNVANRSDIDSLFLECSECGAKRSMMVAFNKDALGGKNGYKCKGSHPHLHDKKNDGFAECYEVLKTRLRSSSSVYFPAIQTALSIPPWSQIAVQIILSDSKKLKFISTDDIHNYIEENLLPKAPKPIKLDDLIRAYHTVMKNKSDGRIQNESDVCLEEYKALNKENMEGDAEFSSFKTVLPTGFDEYFEKIIIVDKLTVVQSLIGFTRLEPWNGSLDDGRLVKLFSDRKKRWLPAIKLFGEGVFIKFNENAVAAWERMIGDRYTQMKKALQNSFFNNDRFSSEYVLLHTFSHLFIRQLSTECGYSTASIKEKIYSTYNGHTDGKMTGVLIYLASSDSDGSLGGLTGIAQNTELFKNIIMQMVQKASWCSADPFCISSTQQGFESLNYAACHDCCLLPETSCEFRNVLLDRVAITGLPENRLLGFFNKLL